MCGIAGIIRSDQTTPAQELLSSMGDTIAHRGPDDVGYYRAPGVGLIHRRLSIIDLSARAHQPMPNEDQTIWLVFNGEIYNYRSLSADLKSRGHVFRSSTDSEVILHAYEEFGVDAVQALNGMFAFALWDSRKRVFFAARDRMGIKPFYYTLRGGTLVFASEIKAILRHPEVTAVPDRSALLEYLLFSHSFSDATSFEGIDQIPPGHYLLFDGEKVTVKPYWRVRFDVDHARSPESFAEELRAAVIDSVRLHLQSDVPLGAHLSGGIDSSSVVAVAAREIGEPLHTFSGAYAENAAYDERPFIDVVRRASETIHREVIPTAAQLRASLARLLWHLDEPVVGPGAFSQFMVSQLVASSGVKVVNGGQGGDELFGGYPAYYMPLARNLVQGGLRAPFGELLRVPQYAWYGGGIQRLFRSRAGSLPRPWIRISPAEAATLHEKAAQAGNAEGGAFEEASYRNIRHYLPGLLQVEDRVSMAWSIESRVPLLDHRLAELAGRMPAWVKIRRGTLKHVLRAAMRGIVPDSILQRRDKKGFPTPVSIWFRGELAQWLRESLTAPDFMSGDLLDQNVLSEMIEHHVSGRADFGLQLWSALNVEVWHRMIARGGLMQTDDLHSISA